MKSLRHRFVLGYKKAGFTLIEFIVYFSLLVLFMTGTVTFLFSLDGLLIQYRLETELYRNSSTILEQVVLTLRQADGYDVGSSVPYPSTSGVLVVDSGASTTEFARVGDELQLTIDGEPYGDLSSDNVLVEGFTVYRYSTTAGDFVRVELDLRAVIGTSSTTETFYGGSVLRGAI